MEHGGDEADGGDQLVMAKVIVELTEVMVVVLVKFMVELVVAEMVEFMVTEEELVAAEVMVELVLATEVGPGEVHGVTRGSGDGEVHGGGGDGRLVVAVEEVHTDEVEAKKGRRGRDEREVAMETYSEKY